MERKPVGGGAELLTVFAHLPDSDSSAGGVVPLVAVLRDSLGDEDPRNDRLRYVWVLSSASPTLLQRGAALIPFFYFRPDLGKNADRIPNPVIDLAATDKGVWTALAASLTQTMALDPRGAIIRSSTHSYRGNLSDYRRTHLVEGLAVLSQLEDEPEVKALLGESALLEMEARLTLAGRQLGGLVGADMLPQAYLKQRTRTEEMRGHNWELLRQRAEANGLYFDPLGLGQSSTHAVLWIARDDIRTPHSFDSKFLNIANPYNDSRLINWSGYTDARMIDGKYVELIPLALYSLDYPKVPLLLADFRASFAPKRREMMRRAASDAVSGVLGISKFGNWPFFAASWSWNFIRTRHGAASDRTARLRAHTEVRQWLAMDPRLDPDLRMELEKRLEMLDMNPLRQSVFDESDIARRQYAALVKYAEDPNGLPARLRRDRNLEATGYEHGLMARAGMRILRAASFGAYTHQEHQGAPLLADLDRERRIEHNVRFLETVARSTPQTEVVWNMDAVKGAIDQLASAGFEQRAARVVEKILHQTNDEITRAMCERALRSLDGAAGQ
jgi:hypothetical protein